MRLPVDTTPVTSDEEHFGLLGQVHASGARVVVAEAHEDALLAAVTPRTRLIAVSHVLWTTGRTLDLERLRQPDGSERLIFATDRRLGAWNNLWKPAGTATATNYEFSVVELRLNARGEGEGKASLSGKVAIDAAANTIALADYTTTPVVFKDVKRKN